MGNVGQDKGFEDSTKESERTRLARVELYSSHMLCTEVLGTQHIAEKGKMVTQIEREIVGLSMECC